MFCLARPDTPQERPQYNIGMLVDAYSTDMANLVKELQEKIKAVVAQEARIHFNENYLQEGLMDLEKVEANYEAYVRNPDIDIILAFGPLHNYVLMKKTKFPKPVVLLGAINQDFINLPKEPVYFRHRQPDLFDNPGIHSG